MDKFANAIDVINDFDSVMLPEPDIEEISTNVERIAVCLCLDTSGSMAGKRIQRLNQGLQYFKECLMKDELAKESTDLAIVSFNDSVKTVLDYTPIKNANMPILSTGGMTYLGEGVLEAMDALEKRKAYYKSKAISYKRPLLFVMTDGEGNGSKQKYEEARSKIAQYAAENKLTAFGIYVDDKSDIKQLSNLIGKQAVSMASVNYNEFFLWLSNSISVISVSHSGDKVSLPPPDWVIGV